VDAVTLINLILAVLALGISGFIAFRQLLTARRANYLTVVLQLLEEMATSDFLESEEYILKQLGADHPGDLGVSGLPVDARTRVWKVAYMYQTIGYLSALRAVDRRVVSYLVGVRAVNAWRSLSPFIVAERRINEDGVGFRFFEDLACRCRSATTADAARRYHLLTFDEPAETTAIRTGGE
jgi:hypothetical protein